MSGLHGGHSIVAANGLHPDKDGADREEKTDGSEVELLTIRDRVEVERELVQDIAATHRRRTRQGMFGGALTSYETCSYDNQRWPCRKTRWAEERLTEQASELARANLPADASRSAADTAAQGGRELRAEDVQPPFRQDV